MWSTILLTSCLLGGHSISVRRRPEKPGYLLTYIQRHVYRERPTFVPGPVRMSWVGEGIASRSVVMADSRLRWRRRRRRTASILVTAANRRLGAASAAVWQRLQVRGVVEPSVVNVETTRYRCPTRVFRLLTNIPVHTDTLGTQVFCSTAEHFVVFQKHTLLHIHRISSHFIMCTWQFLPQYSQQSGPAQPVPSAHVFNGYPVPVRPQWPSLRHALTF